MRYKTHEQLDEDSRRRIDVWRQRARGISVREIAENYNISINTVYKIIREAAEQFEIEAAESLIKLELDRLDTLLVKAMDILETKYAAYQQGVLLINDDGSVQEDPTPVLNAMDKVMKIMDRRSKYLGLDAPTKSEQQINVFSTNTKDFELQNLLQQAQASIDALTPQALEAPPTTPAHDIITIPEQDIQYDQNNQ